MASSTSSNEHGAATSISSLPTPIRAAAFWLAVLLPFCSLAVLIGGLETTANSVLFVGLIIGNVVALVLGHGYGQ